VGAREHWLTAEGDKVVLVSENDGWTYLRRGPERFRELVAVTEIEIREPWSSVSYQAEGYSGALSVTRAEAERWQQWVATHPSGTTT
jgi:hypothetical protein